MHHMTRSQTMAFTGGNAIRLNGMDIKPTPHNKNISYDNIINNLDWSLSAPLARREKSISGGEASPETEVIFENDADEFASTYSVAFFDK